MNILKLTIGFDVSQTGSLKAGCGYYADALIRELCQTEPLNHYVLYPHFGTSFWDPKGRQKTVKINAKNVRRLVTGNNRDDSTSFWASPPEDIEKQLGNPDIVHANNFSCPRDLRKARVVYTLYDLSFLDFPEITTEINRCACFGGVFDASTNADLIISISEFSKNRFLHYFPHYPSERIRVVYPGNRFDGRTIGPRTHLKIKKRKIMPDQFWLAVGTLEPRKNLRRLIEAYGDYREQNSATSPLVVAGGQGWMEEDLENFIGQLNLSDSVFLTGYVTDKALGWLYQQCRCFIYPSLYEGFGLPVLEAMSFGAVVITSHVTSLPEVAGNAAYYINPDSRESIQSALEALDSDPDLRNRFKLAAKDQSRMFSWHKSASLAIEAYQEALQRPKFRTEGAHPGNDG